MKVSADRRRAQEFLRGMMRARGLPAPSTGSDLALILLLPGEEELSCALVLQGFEAARKVEVNGRLLENRKGSMNVLIPAGWLSVGINFVAMSAFTLPEHGLVESIAGSAVRAGANLKVMQARETMVTPSSGEWNVRSDDYLGKLLSAMWAGQWRDVSRLSAELDAERHQPLTRGVVDAFLDVGFGIAQKIAEDSNLDWALDMSPGAMTAPVQSEERFISGIQGLQELIPTRPHDPILWGIIGRALYCLRFESSGWRAMQYSCLLEPRSKITYSLLYFSLEVLLPTGRFDRRHARLTRDILEILAEHADARDPYFPTLWNQGLSRLSEAIPGASRTDRP